MEDADIRHAVSHAISDLSLEGEGPPRALYLGPDRVGNILEVAVVVRPDGSELAIHAMKMRRQYEPLLREGLLPEAADGQLEPLKARRRPRR